MQLENRFGFAAEGVGFLTGLTGLTGFLNHEGHEVFYHEGIEEHEEITKLNGVGRGPPYGTGLQI
ncbi:MAG: hypothetical protein KAR47_19340, partial [Planctomycetes bacterium]|nr:hypothetical protein [Planctomycetota bacterium]